MTQGPRYRLKFKRRRLGVTDYKNRLKLLVSGKPRLAVRRSNRYIYAQLILSEGGLDKTLITVSSKELKGFGYPAGFASTPAYYLTGLLTAKKAIKLGIKEAILDAGVLKPTPKSNTYAFVKGCLDGELDVPCSEDVIPEENRIKGEHIVQYAKILKESDPEKYSRHFSKFLSVNTPPEKLDEVFSLVRQKIMEGDR